MFQPTKISKYFLLLIVLILIQILTNYYFVIKKHDICSWDYDEVYCYYHDAKIYYNAINDGSIFYSFSSLPVDKTRPPLLMILAIPFMYINSSARFILFTNALAIAILLFSVYIIGLKIRGPKTGLIAVIITSGFPLAIVLSRAFMPDYLLAGLVYLSIVFLFLSERFKKLNYTILFGICIGLGMLCKWSFFIYIIGPMVYFLIEAKQNKEISYLYIRRVIFALLFGIMIFSIWYVPFWKETINFLFDVSWGKVSFLQGPSNIFSWKAISMNFLRLNEQIGFIFFIFFLVSVVVTMTSRIRYKWFLILSIFTPYLICIFIRNKHIRLTFPVLPMIAILLAVWISNINRTIIKKIIVIVMVASALINFYFYTFPRIYLENIWSLIPIEHKTVGPFIIMVPTINSKSFIKEVSIKGIKIFSYSIVRSWRPLIDEGWRIKEIVDEIERTRIGSKTINIIVIPDLEQLWAGIFDLTQLRNINARIDIITREEALLHRNNIRYERILDADYVVIKKTWMNPICYGPDPQPALDLIYKNSENFKLLNTFIVLDKDKVLLFKRLNK